MQKLRGSGAHKSNHDARLFGDAVAVASPWHRARGHANSAMSEHTPSFAGAPTLLPYDVLASVLSTPPIWTGSPPSSPHGVWGAAVSTLPSFAGTPPARQPCLPRPFDHCIHSHTPRLLRGFSDLPHSLFGSATEAIATSRS